MNSIDINSLKLPTISVQNFLNDNLEVVKDDHIGEIIKRTGAFSKRELYMLASIFTRISLSNCLEIGGNIGNHTSLFSRFFKHTFVFEPNPLIYKILTNNIKINKLKATAYNFGISDVKDELTFYIDSINLGASSFIKELVKAPLAAITASVVSGDDFVQKHALTAIDYIKIDAEGLEGRIIQGLQETIKQYQPLITLEWNCDETRQDFTRFSLFSTLLSDYTVYSFEKPFPKRQYTTPVKKLKRFILRHICYPQQKLHLGEFHEEKNYDVVLLCPKRFSALIPHIRYTEKITPQP